MRGGSWCGKATTTSVSTTAVERRSRFRIDAHLDVVRAEFPTEVLDQRLGPGVPPLGHDADLHWLWV